MHLEAKEMTISNDDGTEWGPVRSVIIEWLTKSDDRAAEVRFDSHEYDWLHTELVARSYYQLIKTIAISEEGIIAKLGKKGKICIKRLTKEA